MSDRAKTGKSARRLPNGAKEILQDFVVAVLRGKVEPEQFLRFSVNWFQRALDDEEKKNAEQPTASEKTSRSDLGSTSARSNVNVSKQPSQTTLDPEAGAGLQPQKSVSKHPSQTRIEPEAANRDSGGAPPQKSVSKQPSQTTLDPEPTNRESAGPDAQSQKSSLEPESKPSSLKPSASRTTLPAATGSSTDTSAQQKTSSLGPTAALSTKPSGSLSAKPSQQNQGSLGASASGTELHPAKSSSKTTLTAEVGKEPSNHDLKQSGSQQGLEPAKSTHDVKEAKSAHETPPPDAAKGGSAVDLEHAHSSASAQKTDELEPPSRRQGVSAESYDPSAPSTEPDKVFPKTEEQLHRVKEAVKEVLLFRSLDEDHLRKVVDALEEVIVEPGHEVIKIGDAEAEHFYVIEEGEFDCFAMVKGQLQKVTEYINRGSFGELALMYNQPRMATVTARTPGKLWALDRETFKRIIVRGAYEKRKLYMSLMEKVDFLADLQDYEKQNVCDALQPKKYSAGEVVMKQGDEGDGMYFVEAGEVLCTRKEEDNDQEVGRAGPGQYVGELALIAGQPRAATVVATADGTKLAFLDSKAFERLMGPCIDLLRKNLDRYKDKIVAVFGENSAYLQGTATSA